MIAHIIVIVVIFTSTIETLYFLQSIVKSCHDAGVRCKKAQ